MIICDRLLHVLIKVVVTLTLMAIVAYQTCSPFPVLHAWAILNPFPQFVVGITRP